MSDLTPQQKEGRKLFRPKHKEVSEQCASCPFREGNNKEWFEICAKLHAASGQKGKMTKEKAARARIRIMMECQNNGDFQCHHSAYNTDMTLRPAEDRRQCKGATKFFQEGR